MPRTKRPVSKKETHSTNDEGLKKLDRIVSDAINDLDDRAQMQCRDIELAFKLLISSLSPNIMHKTIGELKNELILREVTNTGHSRLSRSASHDDGYLTENSSQCSEGNGKKMGPPSISSKSWGRRSRSADAVSRKPPLSTAKTIQRRQSRSVYKTPAYNKSALKNYPPITPKVAPQTPLTLMRQPRQGEMVVSMSGSPVMVQNFNTVPSADRANCNIVLDDGTVLSLQPKQLRQSQAFIPYSLMDAGVLQQLKTLKDNLDKVVKMGEKAIK